MPHPNVIIILIDDLGYGDLGCYGSTLNRTPRLDRMAAEGMRLTDFYMASPVCSPSRAALMTGCYPRRIGLDTGECGGWVLGPGDHRGLHPDETTIATLLRSGGYRTKHIGKWHLGDQPPFLPLAHGFDSYLGIPFSNDMSAETAYGPTDWPPLPLMRDGEVVETEPNQASLSARYTAEAIDFVTESAEASAPFFLYLAHMYVHNPIHTPTRYATASENGLYGAAVEHLDELTGRLLDRLDELGISEDTLVIFASDNGGAAGYFPGVSNAPLRGRKGETWEGGMRVPCIARWTGRIPAGSVSGELTTAMDLLPTLAGIAGLSVPDDRVIDGRDIGPILDGVPGAASPHEALFYYSAGAENSLAAVRSGRWKLHTELGELYDLESDVGESVDVFGDHPDVVARLEALAEQARADLGDHRTGQVGAGVREPGWVDDPRTLTSMDDLPPTLRALYD